MEQVDELGARIRDLQQSWDIRTPASTGPSLKDGARWLLHKGLGPPLDKQADFNWAIVTGLQLTESALARLTDGKADREQADELRGGLEGVRREFELLRADFQSWSDQAGERLGRTEAAVGEGLAGFASRLERLEAGLAEARAQSAAFAARVDYCLTLLSRCERLVAQAVPAPSAVPAVSPSAVPAVSPAGVPAVSPAGVPAVSPAGAPGAPAPAAQNSATPLAAPPATGRYGGIDYFKFEARFRGSRGEIRRRHEVYAPFMRGPGPIADIGCGRGEFLEAVRDAGLHGVGVELDADMTAFCRSLGLDVGQESGESFLARTVDGSLGGIFLGQVVEHMSPEALAELLAVSFRRLQPGAAFIAETPNPLCPTALANFFIDPTHVRPVHPELFGFLADAAGFGAIEFLFSSPQGDLPPVLRSDRAQPPGADRYMDYALVARRPEGEPDA